MFIDYGVIFLMNVSSAGAGSQNKNKYSGVLFPTLIIVGVLVFAFVGFSFFFTEFLWYQQLGFEKVFFVEILTKFLLFVFGFLLVTLVLFFAIYLAYKAAPIYVQQFTGEDSLLSYQKAIAPFRKLILFVLPAVFGLFFGVVCVAQWQTVLLWLNREPFGVSDPNFGIDLGFYVFTLPFLGFVVGFLIASLIISFLANLVTHYIYGGIKVAVRSFVISKQAKLHIAVYAFLLLMLFGVNFWLGRYSTLQTGGGLFFGATYTDVNAVIPVKTILAIVSGLVALLFLSVIFLGHWRVPIIGTALLVVVSIVAGNVYPWGIQRFVVRPSEQSLEQEYLQRNIDMTRAAYGIDKVQVQDYKAVTTTVPGGLREDAETTASIRLLDPALVSPSFAQLEQFRQYYGFPAQLSVDRYNIDGEMQDTVIAARELNLDGLSGGEKSWYNSRIVYTHGFGVVAAYGNRQSADGTPVFFQSGIPSVGKLGDYEPRIYFGEQSPLYSIVGGLPDGPRLELDFPNDGSAGEGTQNTTFQGDGGPKMGDFLRRVMYAIKFQDEQILLSDAVNDNSQILYERNPRDRVSKVAPYLELDSNVYPAIVDGRVKWIVDGYTTSANYPYSTQETLNVVTEDALNAKEGALLAGKVNYIRNSVKATVDAYDGSVKLYAWDDEDPILRAWQKVFPTEILALSEMSGELVSHVRYPEDLFKVQRSLLGTYHVTSAAEFYSSQDAWSTPNDPTVAGRPVLQPPYFMTLQMPQQESSSFSLTTSFIPKSSAGSTRNVLTGFLAADADAGNVAGVKGDGYGTLRLLELPRDSVIPGPGQVQNNFNSDPEVGNALNLLRQGSSKVENGNLLTLPVGGGLLYVQPVYVRSAGETSFPLLQRVLVAFGDQIGFAPTLNEALDQLFKGSSGALAGDAAAGNVVEDGFSVGVAQALRNAQLALEASRKALAVGDFAAYGVAQKQLEDAVAAAVEAEGGLSSGG